MGGRVTGRGAHGLKIAPRTHTHMHDATVPATQLLQPHHRCRRLAGPCFSHMRGSDMSVVEGGGEKWREVGVAGTEAVEGEVDG